ncbi:hypothetical protein OG542_39875 [Streptomyces violaceus]|uniref:hypothetical protein n=1 Tax=Streptomyces violaceus TaxID=1936 RepID=UPI002E21DA27
MSTSILLLLNLAMNDGAGTARAWIDMGSATSWANTPAFAGDMASLVPQIATASLEELNFGVTLTAVLRPEWNTGLAVLSAHEAAPLHFGSPCCAH